MEPTIDGILQAAQTLYEQGETGFSDVDWTTVGCILKTREKQSRQIWSLWALLGAYERKLAAVGVLLQSLVPPPKESIGLVRSQVILGPTVTLRKVETADGPRIAVSFPYDEHLVSVIKRLKSRAWDGEAKHWVIPSTPVDVEMAMMALRAEGCSLDVDQELRALMEQGKVSYKESRAESAEITIPTKLELYPFQKAGVKWADEHNGRVLIADEMGLGKTPQSLGYVALRAEKTLPALILVPPNVRVTWYRAVSKFTHLKPLLIAGKSLLPSFRRAGLDVSDAPLAGFDVTITNYDLLAVETPKTWLRNLLSPKKDLQAYGEKHLAWAGMQAYELLKRAMEKYKDIENRNRINRVITQIEAQGARARKKRDPEYKIVFVNGVPFENFVKAGYKTLICDESHYLKDIEAQRTVAAIQISETVEHAICLTGTPIDNRPMELWSQIQIVNKGVAPKRFDYGVRYCAGFQKPAARGQMVWDFSGVSNITELDKTLRSTIMIRRTKDQVMKELPPKTRTMIPFVVEDAADKLYRKQEEPALERLRKMKKERDDWKTLLDSMPEADRRSYIAKHAEKAHHASSLKDMAISEIEKLKAAAVNAKFDEAVEFTVEKQATQGKVLVFAVHHDTIDRLVAAFRERKIKTDFIDGRVTGMARQNLIDAFQEGDLEILVCGIRAMSVGANLVASHTVVFIELDWTPGVHSQAEDRTHRIGQTKPVTVYYLLLLGSIEEQIAKMIDSKRAVVNSILGEGDRTAQEAGILDAVLEELLEEKRKAA